MNPFKEIIPDLSGQMLALDSGQLARLRRMEIEGPGEPAYWRLAKECGFLDGRTDLWMQIVKIMAILTPKGRRRPEDRLHEGKRHLGAVLCDGGDPGWAAKGGEPSPALSETRLARFLALPAARRGEALERLARMLAAKRDPASGLDCVELAALLFPSGSTRHLQRIAHDYYTRLDFVTRQEEKKETAP